MKKILTILLLLTTMLIGQEDSVKVYKSGWYLGGGLSYPRYMTISDKSIAGNSNFGMHLTLGYNITEHFGFRLTPHYVLLHSFYYGTTNNEIDNYVNMGTLNLEAVYSILPCERITPYLTVGYGITYFKSSNPFMGDIRKPINDDWVGYQAVLGVGAEFKFWDDLSLQAEFDYITASNNKIDGNDHINEVKGLLQSNGDSYANLKLGAIWYFSRGEKSKICEPFSIREVVKEVPVEVEKVVVDTVYVKDAIVGAVQHERAFVLENVRFKFDKDLLTEEAKIILSNAAKVLNEYPEYDFEILGHTDNIGSDEYNMDLSERRANAVRDYLISQGVDPNRLYAAGCGERKPVADNSTAIGRAINRRIEFSIYDGISSKCPKDETPEETNGKKLKAAVQNGEQLVIEGVFFKFDSDQLTPASEKTLDNVAKVLKEYPNAKIEIQGHTDSLGNDMYNEFLSQRRAETVKSYLVSKGIPEDNLTTVGYGETKPIEDNGTEYGRAVNRRIEFKVLSNDNIEIKTGAPSESMLNKENDEINKIETAIDKGEKLVFTNINFKFNSDEITEPSKKILDNVVYVLTKKGDVKLEIQGHTDSDGPDVYNQDLSERRAESVKKYLVENGISADRLTTKGYGESKPIAENDTKEGKAKNRRIEFIVIK